MGHIILQGTPIDVSQILKEHLFEALDTAVLASATLAVGGGFQYIRQRLGVDHARELIVPSHFDYANQAILYVPPDLPDPRSRTARHGRDTDCRRPVALPLSGLRQQWRLRGAQQLDLGLVQRASVVEQEPADPGIWIPHPVRVAEAFLAQEAHQAALPDAVCVGSK